MTCGAPHETTQVGDPATLRTYLSYTERLKALGRQSRDALDDGRGRNR